MFNKELPRNMSTPYEIQNANGVKTLVWTLCSCFRIQEQRHEMLIQSSCEIIGLFKQGCSALCLNIWMLLVSSQKIMLFSSLAVWHLFLIKFLPAHTLCPPTTSWLMMHKCQVRIISKTKASTRPRVFQVISYYFGHSSDVISSKSDFKHMINEYKWEIN
jgi:hypothetical protein